MVAEAIAQAAEEADIFRVQDAPVDLSAYDVKDRNVPHDKQQEETPKAFRR